ncbi:MAG TPA: DUF2339 domain-containing protein [Fimbriimonadaceae bacterium]|nr:DUF2339 domain-containing protein [Fimbriimonadaceae bacterium]
MDVSSIFERLDSLERRVAALETPQRAFTMPPPPPPIAVRRPALEVVEAPAPITAMEAESFIGSRLLPWVGGIMVLIALITFVAYGVRSGFITPAMLFAGELAFCAAFIGVGLWKRNLDAEFGYILAGIGTCGTYATFFAGHFEYKLFSGEALVALCTAFSLANLALGWFKSSRTFVVFGFVGGFVSAVLPAQRDAYTVGLAIHFCVLFPAMFIAIRHKWSAISIAVWLSAVCALAPLLAESSLTDLKTIGWFGTALLGVLAAFVTSRKNSFDEANLLAPAGVMLSGLGGLMISRSDVMGLGLVAFCVVVGLVVASVRSEWLAEPESFAENRIKLGLASLVTLTCVGPIFLDYQVGAPMFAILAAVGAVAGLMHNRYWSVLGCTHLALGFATFRLQIADRLPETPSLSILAAASIVLMFALNKAAKVEEGAWWRVGASAVAMLAVSVLSRLAMNFVIGPDNLWVAEQRTFTWLLGSVALAIFARQSKAPWLGVSAFGAYLAGLATSPLLELYNLPEPVLVHWGSMLASLLLVTVLLFEDVRQYAMAMVCVAILGWWMFAEGFMLAVAGLDLKPYAAQTIAWTLVGASLLAIGFGSRERVLRYCGFGVFGLTVLKTLTVDLNELEPVQRVAATLVLGLIMLGGGYLYVRRRESDRGSDR